MHPLRRVFVLAACGWLAIVAAANAWADDRSQGWGITQWISKQLFEAVDPNEHAKAELARLGGSRLRLAVDTAPLRALLLADLRNEARAKLREARIAYSALAVAGDHVELRTRNIDDLPRALAALAATSGPADRPWGGAVDVEDAGEGLIRLVPTQRGLDYRLNTALDRNVEVIMRRLETLHVAAANAVRDGNDGIVVLLPGVNDAARTAEVLTRRGQLEFRLVDASVTASEAVAAGAPRDSELLYDKDKLPYVVSRTAALSGRDIAEAHIGLDAASEKPVVAFRFTADGARVFAQLTQENVGRAFAIVLDGTVVSAPIIREPIRGGEGQIEGNFTVQQADDLALLLGSGALAFTMTVVEQRTVVAAK